MAPFGCFIDFHFTGFAGYSASLLQDFPVLPFTVTEKAQGSFSPSQGGRGTCKAPVAEQGTESAGTARLVSPARQQL